MFSLFGDSQSQLEKEQRNFEDAVDESEFVPYACFYDPYTLLTKNGELMQIIKITNFGYDLSEDFGRDLREALRESIVRRVRKNNVSLWVHTIRRKADLRLKGAYPKDYAGYLHYEWQQKGKWQQQYVNELFVSVVYEGQEAELRRASTLLRGLFSPMERRYRHNYLAEAATELNLIVKSITDDLEPFAARKLGMYERDGATYSEHLNFLGRIINMSESEMPVPHMDLSAYLPTHDYEFSHQEMEVRGPTGKHYGTIISIKEYKEISTLALDRFSQLPEEFIVSQALVFAPNTKAVQDLKEFKEPLEISGELEISERSGLDELLSVDTTSSTSLMNHQINILLYEDDIDTLDAVAEKTVGALQTLGVLCIREEVKLEEAFWAMLPGNFEFLRRLKPLPTKRLGGLSNLANFSGGNPRGNPWGEALTIFNTAAKTPYYFNLHHEGNGHGLILGPEGSGKTTMLNYLLTLSTKFQPRIWAIDQNRHAAILAAGIGGAYAQLANQQDRLRLNPFSLDATPTNREFLLAWLEMLSGQPPKEIRAQVIECWQQALIELYSQTGSPRTLASFVAMVSSVSPEFARPLLPWTQDPNLAWVFGSEEDDIAAAPSRLFLDMDELRGNSAAMPVIMYLIHRFNLLLDGGPAIFSFDGIEDLLDPNYFAHQINGWLEYLTSRNALCLFSATYDDSMAPDPLIKNLVKSAPSHYFLPGNGISEAVRELFDLNEKELLILEMLANTRNRQLVLRRPKQLYVLEFPLTPIAGANVLSASEYDHAFMQKVMAQHGSEPSQWLPPFLQVISGNATQG